MKKRIALSAVVALFAGLLAAAPASAAPGAAPDAVTGSVERVRTDDTTYKATLASGTGTAVTIEATEANNNDFETDKVKVGYKASSAATEVLISTVTGTASGAVAAGGVDTVNLATGVSLSFDNGNAGDHGLGTPVAGVYTIADGTNSTSNDLITLELARNAVPGIYTLYVGTSAAVYTSDSVAVVGAPTTLKLFKNGSTTVNSISIVGDVASNQYDAWVTDGVNPTYLIGSERIGFAVSGGSGSGVTVTTPALQVIGAGDITASSTAKYTATLKALSASGTYTLTATPANWTATAATATLAVSSDANVSQAGTRLLNASSGASSSDTVLGFTPYDTTENTTNVDTYLPADTKTITLSARFPANTTGDAKVTVSSSTIAGVNNGVYLATIVSGAITSTATFTFTATAANNNDTAEFVLDTDGGGLGVNVTYKNPVAGYLEFVTPAVSGDSVIVAPGSTNTIKVSVTDQFGRALPGVSAVMVTSGTSRNASKSFTATTSATGEASFTLVDASTSTTNIKDDITVTAGNGSDSFSYVYTTKTVGSVVLKAELDAADADGAYDAGAANGAYSDDITTAKAPSVGIDTSLGSLNNTTTTLKIANQVLMTVTVKDAAGAVLEGQKVTVSGTTGSFFAAGGTAGDVPQGKQSTAVSTVDVYSDSNGVAKAQIAFTKTGTQTITVTAGGVTKTWALTVTSGVAGQITASASGNQVTAKVTDLYGNPVAGENVTFSVSGASFSSGFSSATGTTATDGTVTTNVIGSGKVTVTVSHGGADKAAVADATNGLPAGVAKTTVELTAASATTTDAATTAALAEQKAAVATLNTAVAALQTTVASLVASMTAQIKVINAALVKIAKKLKVKI